MEVIGKIIKIGETQSFGTNGFKKRDIVVSTDEQYPQKIQIEFVQDKTSILDNYEVNDDVKININLRGREWVNPEGEAKYFNSIQGWRIEKLSGHANPPPMEEYKPENGEPDDLPF